MNELLSEAEAGLSGRRRASLSELRLSESWARVSRLRTHCDGRMWRDGMLMGTNQLVRGAWRKGLAVPAFNIPYIPMMEPVVRAVRDTKSFALIAVARPEWIKFEAGSPRAIRDEYARMKDDRHVRLHLDHVPVIDEEGLDVDCGRIIREAIELGYQSVMVDGSRLSLDQNIAATREVVEMAH